jgi:CBS-domain-containing membrane protein
MATYQQLFNLCKKKFNISWLYGQSHANEKLFLTEKAKQYPTLCVGFLNIIHPDRLHIIERVGDIRPLKIRDVMTPNPTTIQPQALAAEAAKILNSTLRNQLLVVDDSDRLIGALHIHDLMTAKVI